MDYFSEEQTYSLLTEMGVQVITDTDVVWMCLCPFHSNQHTPAFAVSKDSGVYYCFNESCAAQGNLLSLVMQLTKKTTFQAMRMIAKAQSEDPVNVTSLIEKSFEDEDLPEFSQRVLDGMEDAFWGSDEAQAYMASRGFNEGTLKHYHVGFSPKKNMIGVPMHDLHGKPIGLIGRSIKEKRFKNSSELPKKSTIFNIHRAKRRAIGVVVESSFDAARVWQSYGYDALATLGSSFSPQHAAQVNKYFTDVIIMTDDDQKLLFNKSCRKCKDRGMTTCVGHNTGFELGMQIAKACRGLSVKWAHLDSLKRYDGHKDAGDLTDDQIAYAIENAVPHIEMVMRGVV